MDLRGRAQEEAGRNCMRNAYESRVDKNKIWVVLGELILAITFLLDLVLKQLDGRI
jgi:hypothetical protein